MLPDYANAHRMFHLYKKGFTTRKEALFMNKFNYASIFAPYMHNFIAMKNACGYDALRTKWILFEFDNFFVLKGAKELHIKKVQIEKWRDTRINDSDRTLYSKYSVWSQFCRYMCHTGIECYIPRLPKQPDCGFTPYIFSHEQMQNIFQACDELRLYDRHMHVNIMALPSLIRLLYSTGLRISEALSIKNEDVDLTGGVVLIKKTKNGEQRLAPLTENMSAVLREYMLERNKIPINGVNKPDSFLFVSLTGKPCVSGSIYQWFRKILKICNIPHTGNHHGPGVHDLRHTCAVHSLIKMCEEGVDLYCALPLLSAFIGHKSIDATEQYVRLTAEMYPQLINQQKEQGSYVFPVIQTDKSR
jgi:integrase